MSMIKGILGSIVALSFVITKFLSHEKLKEYRSTRQLQTLYPIRAAVLLYRFDDEFIAEVRKSLENIQAQNQGKVQFTFYDGMGNQAIQNQTLVGVLNEGTDLFLVNLVDIEEAQNVIDRIKQYNIPVILFNREPRTADPMKSYSKSCYIGTDARQAGVLQGRILVEEWNNNRINTDTNHDDILQYIMLTGNSDNIEAIGRTKYSVLAIKSAGINTEELALRVCNWDRELARKATESLYFRFGNRIEAIIANNDAMAIGAIELLQSVGYNTGDPSRTIAVVGVDALDEAQDLIAKGYMTGTVLQDNYAMAESLYLVGMNFVFGRSPLEGTNYTFDETGVAIRLPYREYIKS